MGQTNLAVYALQVLLIEIQHLVDPLLVFQLKNPPSE